MINDAKTLQWRRNIYGAMEYLQRKGLTSQKRSDVTESNMKLKDELKSNPWQLIIFYPKMTKFSASIRDKIDEIS